MNAAKKNTGSIAQLSTAAELRRRAAAALAKANESLDHTRQLRTAAQEAQRQARDIEKSVGPSLQLGEEEREAFHTELLGAIQKVCDKHGVDVEFGDLSISEVRGIMHLPVRMVTKAYNAWRKANPYFRERGQTQAEMRFNQFHSAVGLNATDLHDRFDIDGVVYEVLGLKGRNHKVLLRPLNAMANTTTLELPADEFREMIGRSQNDKGKNGGHRNGQPNR